MKLIEYALAITILVGFVYLAGWFVFVVLPTVLGG